MLYNIAMDTNPFTGRSVLVCIQHALTEEQMASTASAASLTNLKDAAPEVFASAANIDPAITPEDINALAFRLAKIITQFEVAILPIGSPELQCLLTRHLLEAGVQTPPVVVFARTRRESVDTTNPDGSVVKSSVFKHAGWGTVSF